ncbi:MAG: ABC transporter permease subunit, partial [Chlorobi bacterium]|nr:ABC transporter permease subunit [Chlorobiota bacterium]
IMITFLILSALTIIGFGLAFSLMGDSVDAAALNITGETPQNISDDVKTAGLRMLEFSFASTLYVIGLFFAIFSTAGLIPDMLKKGNIDLFLSKPISKFELLTGKYLGALAVVFVNIVFLVGSIWLMVGLKFSFWEPSFLFTIAAIMYVFAAIYALITLTGILTKSSVLPTIISFLIIIIVNPMLGSRESIYQLTDSVIVKGILETLYYIMPQAQKIIGILQSSILGKTNLDFTPILTTGALLIAYLGLSYFVFKKKDF